MLATASSSRTLCLCAVGYASIYANKSIANPQDADMTCVPCPDGAVCDTTGIVWEQMAAQPGQPIASLSHSGAHTLLFNEWHDEQ